MFNSWVCQLQGHLVLFARTKPFTIYLSFWLKHRYATVHDRCVHIRIAINRTKRLVSYFMTLKGKKREKESLQSRPRCIRYSINVPSNFPTLKFAGAGRFGKPHLLLTHSVAIRLLRHVAMGRFGRTKRNFLTHYICFASFFSPLLFNAIHHRHYMCGCSGDE